MAGGVNSVGAGLDIRLATAADLEAVAAIYNHYVIHSTCTFATDPEPPAYWENWLRTHTGKNPAIVAVRGGEVIGWGTLSGWNNRCAYRFTAENSVYVRDGCRGGGIGREILAELIRLARAAGLRSLVAQIADHQAASEALHERAGYRRVGVLEGVGFKFDRWIDVVIWQLQL